MPGYTTAMSETRKHRRRWFQYSLGSLMLFVFLVSLGMSWYAVRAKRAREQSEAVEEILKLYGDVLYDYQVQGSGARRAPADPPGPAWLRRLLGVDFFETVVAVDFGNPNVTDADLRCLERLAGLKELSMDSPHVTDTGLERRVPDQGSRCRRVRLLLKLLGRFE